LFFSLMFFSLLIFSSWPCRLLNLEAALVSRRHLTRQRSLSTN
jgi:hypothetical protein